MSNEKMREEFEAWAAETTSLWLMPVMFDGDFVNYYDEDAAEAFNIWQASRAALCVELPDFEEDCGECHYHAGNIKTALDDAGVRYK